MEIIDGKPHSPYFVFIRNTIMEDSELLTELGLQSYSNFSGTEQNNPYICITRDDAWTHLADDWFYTHWHSHSFKEQLLHIAQECDLFSFSVGDSDMSFDFELHRRGVLERRVVWVDPNYDGGYLKEEFGRAMSLESQIPKR